MGSFSTGRTKHSRKIAFSVMRLPTLSGRFSHSSKPSTTIEREQTMSDDYVNPFSEHGTLEVPGAGGYNVFAVTGDGGLLCYRCIIDPQNPISDARTVASAYGSDGWDIVAFDHDGNLEDLTVCDHCNATLCEDPIDHAFREDFVSAYLECALWASHDEDGENFAIYTESDIDSKSRDEARQECYDFIEANKWDLLADGNAGQHGHDFWLTRNRHGAGFWDRGYADRLGDRLTSAAHVYGEANVYLGDNGKLYID